jgi:TonB family protein
MSGDEGDQVPFVPGAEDGPGDVPGVRGAPAAPRHFDAGDSDENDSTRLLESEPEPLPDAEEERGPSFLGKSWPIFAAALLAAATLVAVQSLLHPRGGDASTAAVSGLPAFVTLDGAELRREPSASAEALATLNAGAKVEAFATRGTWLEAEADGKRGWLPVDVVERVSDRDARRRREKTLLAFTPVYGVVGESADVLLAPYPLAPRAGKLAKGTVIAIHSVDHSYFAYRDKDGGIAFVGSAAVDLIPPDPKQPAIEPEKVRPLKDLTIIDLDAQPPYPDESLEEATAEDEKPAPPREAGAAPAPPPPAPAGLLEGPTLVTRVEPVYPDVARRAGIEGTVELEVSIDAKGKVTEVEVVRGLPLGLSDAAADAVRKWKYQPARAASGPVASRKSVRIRFVLRSG